MDAYAVPPEQLRPQQPGFPQQPPERPRNLRGLSTALTVLLVVIAVALALNALALLGRASLLDDAVNGARITPDEADGADTLVLLTAGVYLLLAVAIAVVFIIWQYRHAKNAKVLGSNRKLGPGWAIGGWFVPIANAVIPGKQIFGASKHSDNDGVGIRYEGGRGAGIVVWWAIALNLGGYVTNYAYRVAPADTVGDVQYLTELAESDRIEVAGDVILIAAAVLAIVMIRTLTARQETALARAAADGLIPGENQFWAAGWQPAGYVSSPYPTTGAGPQHGRIDQASDGTPTPDDPNAPPVPR